MAKQLINPIERHVEKAVLGVAGLGLVAAIGLYLASSPNQIELGGQTVKPTTIDQVVAKKAAAARETMRNAQAEVEMPTPLSKEFEKRLRPFAADRLMTTWPPTAPLEPDVPIIDAPGVVTGQRNLAKVVGLEKTVAISGRSTLPLGGVRVAVNWVTLSGAFDVKKQMAALAKEYGAANRQVIFGPIQAERRARREDGAWSDDDWTPIEPLAAERLPATPRITLIPEGDHFIVPGEDMNNIASFARRIAEPGTQWEIVRPMLPTMFNGSPWSPPDVVPLQELLLSDDYFQNPDKPPSANPVNRYVAFETAATPGTTTETPEQALTRAEDLRKTAWEQKSPDQIVQAFNIALSIEEDKTLGTSIRLRAKKLREAADATDSDIRRYLLTHGPVGKEETATAVREPPPRQQLWLHDAQPGSVASGKTYQYRMRPTIYNILVGEPDKFRNPQDATALFIPGPWTEPLEVSIQPDTHYFLASDDERNKDVSVELFRWYEGIWVKSRFKYGVGDRLTGQARCDVPRLDGGEGFETPLIDFQADATIVDIDFRRIYRERKRGSGRNGVQFSAPAPATSVVLVDQEGRLQERFVPLDRVNPAKKDIVVWRPQKGGP